MIRLTIARYHTPSGRCIQKPYEDGDTESYGKDMLNRYNSGEFSSADSIQFADSLKYATLRNGRVVYGGGGIMPDRFVAIDTTFYSKYYRDMVAKGVLNQFGIDYVDRHRDALNKQYRSESEFVQRFVVTDQMMQSLIDRGEKDGVKFDEEQYATSREYMRVLLKALIARDLYDISAYYRVANLLNPIYVQGLQLINNPDEYDSLLHGTARK
jgi:carboxyl-terminal processing protease